MLPLIQTFDQFWVKNEDPFGNDMTWTDPRLFSTDLQLSTCTYFDREGLKTFSKNTVWYDYCYLGKSFVCEKNLY